MACVLRPVKTRPTPEHSQVCHAGLTAHLLSCKETLWCSNTACCGHTDEHVRVTATMLVSVVESHLWSCYSEGCSCCRGGRSWRDAVLGLSLSLSLSLSQSLLGNHHELAQLRSHQHHPLNKSQGTFIRVNTSTSSRLKCIQTSYWPNADIFLVSWTLLATCTDNQA